MKKPENNIRASTGFKPVPSAIPVRLSHKLSINSQKDAHKSVLKLLKSCYFKSCRKVAFFFTCLHLKLALLRLRSCRVLEGFIHNFFFKQNFIPGWNANESVTWVINNVDGNVKLGKINDKFEITICHERGTKKKKILYKFQLAR